MVPWWFDFFRFFFSCLAKQETVFDIHIPVYINNYFSKVPLFFFMIFFFTSFFCTSHFILREWLADGSTPNEKVMTWQDNGVGWIIMYVYVYIIWRKVLNKFSMTWDWIQSSFGFFFAFLLSITVLHIYFLCTNAIGEHTGQTLKKYGKWCTLKNNLYIHWKESVWRSFNVCK